MDEPGTGRPGDADEVIARVREGIEVFNSGDYEGVLAYFDDDAVIDSSAAFVVHAPYEGIAGVRDFYASIAQLFEEFRVEPFDIRRRGDVVLVCARTIWKLREGGDAGLAEQIHASAQELGAALDTLLGDMSNDNVTR